MAVQDEDDEKPLDPAVLKVQARLRLLMLIAAGTLGLGLFAVVMAIIYRIATLDDSETAAEAAPATLPALAGRINGPPALATLDRGAAGLGEDARLVATELDGDRALLTFEDGQRQVLILVDLPTGTVISRLVVE